MPNYGEKIVEQYMRRNRWFVPAPTVGELAQQIIARSQPAGKLEPIGSSVLEQVSAELSKRMKRGEIKVCKHAGGSGYRKASKREVERFKRRGLPGYKPAPNRAHAPTRKRKVATALAT